MVHAAPGDAAVTTTTIDTHAMTGGDGRARSPFDRL
jgi:hypothetical protein